MPARLATLFLALLAAIGCAANKPSDQAGAAEGGVVLRVDNQTASDMDVYVLRREGPLRVGFAPAQQVTRLAVAPGLIAGTDLVRFEGRPPLGRRVVSDPYPVRPGDALEWIIPPQ